jgi:galactose-1-phosphate uridylyltransferase
VRDRIYAHIADGADSFELFAEAQRDLTPETGAQKIRGCSEEHYKRSLG